MSAFTYYIQRQTTLPITEEPKQIEWQTVLAIAKNNGYPTTIIDNLKKKTITRKPKQQDPSQQTTEARKNG